jgi:hypothetical protein
MSVLLETRVTRLSLAVRLLDDFTGAGPRGAVSVAIGDRTALRKPSGHFLFLDLPPGMVLVTVAPDYYLAEELTTVVPRPDPRDPVVEQALVPNRLYPFPRGSTLVRGLVRSTAGDPVAGASVQGVGRPTRTGTDGRFVAYFTALTEDDVVLVGPERRRLVKAADGSTDLDLSVSHPLFQTASVTVSELEEGSERLLAAPVLLTSV